MTEEDLPGERVRTEPVILARTLLLLAGVFAMVFVLVAATSGRPVDKETLAAAQIWFGIGGLAFGIGVPSGAVMLDPSDFDVAWGGRIGRAVARGFVPLCLGIGSGSILAGADAAWGLPTAVTPWLVTALVGVCGALWLLLVIAGVPTRLLPLQVREHGPRTIWAEVPDAFVYRRTSMPLLDRFRSSRDGES